MRTDEFDAFGPWIDEVTTVENTPPLYRDYPLDFAQKLLVLKVPRNIARRDADPTMHLYDQLVIVDHDSLTVLTRDADAYGVRVAAHTEVLALEDTVHLLDGRLVVHLTTGPAITIAYNGSARESITRLVDTVRRLAAMNVDTPPATQPTPDSATGRAVVNEILGTKRDHGLRSDATHALAVEPGSAVRAGHATTLARPGARSLKALTHRLVPAFVQGAVVMGNAAGSEASVLHRRTWVVRGRTDDLSHGRTIVFTSRVTAVATAAHTVYPGLTVVSVTGGAATVEFVVPTSAPTASAIERVCMARPASV